MKNTVFCIAYIQMNAKHKHLETLGKLWPDILLKKKISNKKLVTVQGKMCIKP